MTVQEIQNASRAIADYIEQQTLYPAIRQLFTWIDAEPRLLAAWTDRLTAIEENYVRLLDYRMKGVIDPEEESIYRHLIRSIYQISDAITLQLRTQYDHKWFYALKRLHTEQLVSDKNAQMFHSILLSDAWTKDERLQWTTRIEESPTIGSLIIVALTLNQLETFDEQKAILLLEMLKHPVGEISDRAMVGLMLFLRQYDRRLHRYPEITGRLHTLSEDAAFIRRVRSVMQQFILSRDTEKITQKISAEMIPEMLEKLAPKIQQHIHLQEFLGDLEDDDKNPEWVNIIEESGLTDKFQEVSEWQLEGADVMLSSFIHMKHFPFFNDLHHWFLLFEIHDEHILNDQLQRMAELLQASTLLCNSDKYSFLFSLSQMPEHYIKMLTQQFEMENKAIKEMQHDELPSHSLLLEYRVRQYIQDLYRFYKLHPHHTDFEDIFTAQPEFYKVNAIAELLQNPDDLMMIGEYYFHRNYWQDAEDVFGQLSQNQPKNDVIWQKRGYCLQMLGQLEAALAAYQRAELLNSNHSWTIKKLAHLHRLLKNPQEALNYYRKAEQFNPDNLSVQLNIGHCLVELKEYDAALKQYFKVEYLSKNQPKVWRPLAWTAFLAGKYEQATQYYAQLLENEPQAIDYLNAGHVQLALKNPQEAIRLYRLAQQTGQQSPLDFIAHFRQDLPELTAAGITASEIALTLDAVFYEI
ncbi:MAG: tetratricopeptide repeat protein [Candidatus Symbiothrix sp.]|jgi:tetratricopeptide (TPR) repeat protein|nr:tetratricopeptide repeat protein [Candidatus Symbiothrix sp.]